MRALLVATGAGGQSEDVRGHHQRRMGVHDSSSATDFEFALPVRSERDARLPATDTVPPRRAQCDSARLRGKRGTGGKRGQTGSGSLFKDSLVSNGLEKGRGYGA